MRLVILGYGSLGLDAYRADNFSRFFRIVRWIELRAGPEGRGRGGSRGSGPPPHHLRFPSSGEGIAVD